MTWWRRRSKQRRLEWTDWAGGKPLSIAQRDDMVGDALRSFASGEHCAKGVVQICGDTVIVVFADYVFDARLRRYSGPGPQTVGLPPFGSTS